MKDRIIQFLSANNLTSTKFADEIGVQRSSISHLLSGRNKPSFDFIEKMLLTYPDLDAQWLITGKGNMYVGQPSLFNQQENEKTEEILTSSESNIQKTIEYDSVKSISDREKQETEHSNVIRSKNLQPIERVIVFYTNGSFKEYKPE